jgi:hypothetical protein
MNTKEIGDISEAMVIAAFLKAGKNVLIPFGDKNRYDVVIEQNGIFERVQIKTGRKRGEIIEFPLRSSTRRNGQRVETPYQGQIESFAVYCPETDKVYVVPIDVCGKALFTLRLSKSKSGSEKNVHYASDYEFKGT